jgi:predicted Zn-ribbon and HTH transcriptional regulator
MSGRKDEHLSGLRPPPVAHDTIRHELLVELEEGPLSAHELSGRISISEKDVYEHLTHIRATLHRSERHLVVQPAECAKCGFIFHKRERLTKPSKCPVCRGESIHEPLFSLAEKKQALPK